MSIGEHILLPLIMPSRMTAGPACTFISSLCPRTHLTNMHGSSCPCHQLKCQTVTLPSLYYEIVLFENSWQKLSNKVDKVTKWIKACVCHYRKRKLCLFREMSQFVFIYQNNICLILSCPRFRPLNLDTFSLRLGKVLGSDRWSNKEKCKGGC